MATRKGRQVSTETRTGTGEAGGEPGDPLFGVALLKIALELKRPGAPVFDEVVGQVITRMGLAEDEFRRFLAEQGGLLKSLARQK